MTTVFTRFSVRLTIGGSAPSGDVLARLNRVVVDRATGMPDRCVIEFWDPTFGLLETAGFKIGSDLVVRMATDLNPNGDVIFTGEVCGVEAEVGPLGARTVLRGYDKMHRLQRGSRTVAYVQKSYSDIARQLAGRAGLGIGKLDATGTVFAHVAQPNVDDWTFLQLLAARVGYVCSVDAGKLSFCKPSSLAATNPPTFAAGDPGIRSLRCGVTAGRQVSGVQARGWDPSTKKPYLGNATAPGSGKLAPSKLASTFSAPKLVVVDDFEIGQGGAETRAGAVADDIASASVDVRGEVWGTTTLKPGGSVSLVGFGSSLSGTYTVSSVTHVYDAELDGFWSQFSCSPADTTSLFTATTDASTNRFRGVVPALISDINDPSHAGRVKLTFPWLDDAYVSDWARVLQPGAGSTRGLQVLPEVNDEVLVAFEDGDLARPYVLGGLWNGKDTAPIAPNTAIANGVVNQRAWVSRTGHRIVLDDTKDNEKITVASGDGKHTVVITAGSKPSIAITSSGDVNVSAGGNVSINAKGSGTVKAQGAVNVESQSSVTVKAASSATLEGTSVTVKGSSNLSLQSSGIVEIKGSLIKLN